MVWSVVVVWAMWPDVGDRRGVGQAISGGGHWKFFEKMDFCESLREQYDPNENQIYEHKWDYFVCRIGEC